jgi:hypothetical protein
MTGNGNHITYKNSDDWGMVYDIVWPTLDDFPIRTFIISGISQRRIWLPEITVDVPPKVDVPRKVLHEMAIKNDGPFPMFWHGHMEKSLCLMLKPHL